MSHAGVIGIPSEEDSGGVKDVRGPSTHPPICVDSSSTKDDREPSTQLPVRLGRGGGGGGGGVIE